MTSEEHLRISEILAFRERRLSGTKRSAATAHLLRCEECRDRLPKPTVDEFWRCLMGEDEELPEVIGIGSAWESAKNYLPNLIRYRSATRNAVFASMLLLAVLGFSLLLMIGPEGSPVNKNLVAAVGDSEQEDNIPTASFDYLNQRQIPTSDTSSSTAKPDERVHETTGGNSARTIATPNRKILKQSGRQTTAMGTRKLAETRGNIPCGGQRFVVLEAKLTDEGLLLAWEKVSGAAAYNIYLSDLDERLAAQYETSDKTSYLVTAKLDPDIIYRLRLVASLENGERVVSESQNFTINDLKKGSRSFGGPVSRKKTSALVRCVEVKQ